MRTNIYYWKCDNPLSVEEKLVYNDKYKLADISETVRDIATLNFKKKPLKIESTGSSGNHYAYRIIFKDKTYFFRSDDGKIDDDYMDAERKAIELSKKADVLVPEVLFTDTSLSKFPVRYQIMENVDGESMKTFFNDKTLNIPRVSNQLGELMAKIHSVEVGGFGFFNTQILREKNSVVGLDKTNKDYFNKCLDKHLKFLRDTDFLNEKEVNKIMNLIDKNAKYLDLNQGHLVHKDIAFWNMIGTADKISAIVDWDDVVSGDPVDDLSVIRCFYDENVFSPLLDGYKQITELDDDFYPKLWLYLIRNMLWKSVFRTFMKYFDLKEKVVLLKRDDNVSLKQFTYNRLMLGVQELEKL